MATCFVYVLLITIAGYVCELVGFLQMGQGMWGACGFLRNRGVLGGSDGELEFCEMKN